MMNDRYLFRAKRVENGEWVEGGSIITFLDGGIKSYYMPAYAEKCICTHDENDNITSFENCIFYKVDPSTICQCTGLRDKNGKLVWENDIITISAYDYLEPTDDYTGIVRYFEKDACWCLRDFDEKDKIIPICECYGDYTTKIFKLGNIFDNPELLKQEG